MELQSLPDTVWLYYGQVPEQVARKVAEKSQQIFQRVLSDEEYVTLVDARNGDIIRISPENFEQHPGTGNFLPLIYIKLIRTIRINFQYDQVSVAYGISNKDNAPELTLLNFEVPKEAQGKGLATRLFATQVEAARKLGFDRIVAYADYRNGRNGYYTWPRLGFDKPLSVEEQQRFPADLKPVNRLSDIIAHPTGRTWWRNNGSLLKFNMEVTFHIAPESRSMQYLRSSLEALEQKGAYWDSGADTPLRVERGTFLRPRRDWQNRIWELKQK